MQLYDEVRFEGMRNRPAIDFIRRAMEKEAAKRKTIYELINHPFLTPVGDSHCVF
jgi:serine/threonine protein kinase